MENVMYSPDEEKTEETNLVLIKLIYKTFVS
jgi:hypothetical protein